MLDWMKGERGKRSRGARGSELVVPSGMSAFAGAGCPSRGWRLEEGVADRGGSLEHWQDRSSSPSRYLRLLVVLGVGGYESMVPTSVSPAGSECVPVSTPSWLRLGSTGYNMLGDGLVCLMARPRQEGVGRIMIQGTGATQKKGVRGSRCRDGVESNP